MDLKEDNDCDNAFDTINQNKIWPKDLFKQLCAQKQDYFLGATGDHMKKIVEEEVATEEVDIAQKKLHRPKPYPTKKKYSKTFLAVNKKSRYDQKQYCHDVRKIWEDLEKDECTCSHPQGWCRTHENLPNEQSNLQINNCCK